VSVWGFALLCVVVTSVVLVQDGARLDLRGTGTALVAVMSTKSLSLLVVAIGRRLDVRRTKNAAMGLAVTGAAILPVQQFG
jgi:hypothetical protein